VTGRRPRTVEELRALSGFSTEEGWAKGLAFKPDRTDIFISPYAKCGTTWMQQIVHGLRTGGDMSFGEITEAVPWIEMAHDLGLDPADQPWRPRAFKSHLDWETIPKGGRYIVVLRDPIDAFISYHRFLDGWRFERGSISVDDLAGWYLEAGGRKSWWGHTASWLRVRGRSDVLLLTYEAMRRDLGAAVDRVAAFMGGIAQAARATATRQASFAFMKAHERQFDDHFLRARRDPACGLPPGGEATKVADGGMGPRAVSDALRDRFACHWAETIAAEFGIADYAALARAID